MIKITEQEALQILARLEHLPYRNVHDIMDFLKAKINEAQGVKAGSAPIQDEPLPGEAPIPN